VDSMSVGAGEVGDAEVGVCWFSRIEPIADR